MKPKTRTAINIQYKSKYIVERIFSLNGLMLSWGCFPFLEYKFCVFLCFQVILQRLNMS